MLFLYDFEFNLIGCERKVISTSWEIHFNEIGTFRASLPLTSPFSKAVMENQYIVAVQNGFSAIIVGYEMRDELILYGRTCNWLFTKRICDAASKSGYAGDLAAEIASSAFSDVSNFSIGNAPSGGEVTFDCREESVWDALRDCLDLAGMGHSLDFDTKQKKWIFNILNKRDTKIIFSEGHKNAYNTMLSADILDLATCGRYTHETEDGSSVVYLEGEKQGIYRWEALLDGKTNAEAVLSLEKLKEKREALLCVRNVKFGEDYRLGDVVRLQIIKGNCRSTIQRMISGIKMTESYGEYTQQPIFK